MATSEDGWGADEFTIAEAARLLDADKVQLLALLLQERLIYRYTGIGRPLAYVRWVRAGLFVNTAAGLRITRSGLERVSDLRKGL
jgi:hypothetical protein